jgi:hypothetical protein
MPSDWAGKLFERGRTRVECWICGGEGTTREHKIKRTDLRSRSRNPTQENPIRFHDSNKKNFPIRSVDADILKFEGSICAYCNNTRTQPHDRAWETMSAWFRTRTSLTAPGMIVNANKIFQYDTRLQMLNVHLYFVKVLGCQIVKFNISIALCQFARAISLRKAHPHVYLRFGQSKFKKGLIADGSDAETLSIDGVCIFLTLFRGFQDATMNLLYAAEGEERRDGLKGAWHPRHGTQKLVFFDF